MSEYYQTGDSSTPVIDYSEPTISVWRNPLLWIILGLIVVFLFLGYLGKFTEWREKMRMASIERALKNAPVPTELTTERMAAIEQALREAPKPAPLTAERIKSIEETLKKYK